MFVGILSINEGLVNPFVYWWQCISSDRRQLLSSKKFKNIFVKLFFNFIMFFFCVDLRIHQWKIWKGLLHEKVRWKERNWLFSLQKSKWDESLVLTFFGLPPKQIYKYLGILKMKWDLLWEAVFLPSTAIWVSLIKEVKNAWLGWWRNQIQLSRAKGETLVKWWIPPSRKLTTKDCGSWLARTVLKQLPG